MANLETRIIVSARDMASRDFRRIGLSMEGLKKRVFSLQGAFVALGGAYAGYRFGSFIKDSALLAARFETLGVAMRTTGKNAGYSAGEMAIFEKSLNDAGISMIESRAVLTSMAAANIELTKSSKLARAAQDLAVVGNINSSEAFARMVHGIKGGSRAILRTLGLQVQWEVGYKSLAKQLGKNTKELTEQEKLQSRINSVLEASKGYMGVYEKSMASAGKQLNSLDRHYENFKVHLGEAFQPFMVTFVGSLTNAVKSLDQAVSDETFKKSLEDVGRLMGLIVRGMGKVAEYAPTGISLVTGAHSLSAASRIEAEENLTNNIEKQIESLQKKQRRFIYADERAFVENQIQKLKEKLASRGRGPIYTPGQEEVSKPGPGRGGGTGTAQATKKAAEGMSSNMEIARARITETMHKMVDENYYMTIQFHDAWIESQNKVVQAAVKAGNDFTNGWRAGMKEYVDLASNTFEQTKNLARDTAMAMQQSFSDFFFDAMTNKFKSFADYAQSFLTSIQRAMAGAMAQHVTGGIMGGMFGGGRASGGPVLAGTSYLVGERGPELFTPGRGGSITPNERMGGDTIINNFTLNFSAIDSRSLGMALEYHKRQIVGMVQEAYTRRHKRGPLGYV